ncbi:GAP family protein [Nocardiopsis sp. HNM0947]|uniref:GAP family protein n=1 Tax=Nocardiopsis coralli TaxID=2772213 RepID=A0ABR9P6P4_9ACTN|nr:GAP family protein [Nocardiopsis coralli]MBE2999518.1 GAP family protein [Nocardiopsis coralli]
MPTLETLLPVAGLALLDTLSPTTLGVSLFVLLSGVRNVGRPLTAYLATVAAFYFALGCALMLGLGAVLERAGSLAGTTAAGWVMVVVGGALFAYSWVMPTGPKTRRRPASLRTTSMIALGLATGALEAGTAFPYLGAIGIMTAADLAPGAWVPMLAAYNLMMVLPPVLLYLGHRALGSRMRPRLERWRAKVDGASREAMAWILGIVGVLLLVNGAQTIGLRQLLDSVGL